MYDSKSTRVGGGLYTKTKRRSYLRGDVNTNGHVEAVDLLLSVVRLLTQCEK